MNDPSPQAKDVFAEKTVLIVDEHPTLRQVLGEIFGDLGCNVLAAASGQEAIFHFEQNSQEISLILLELDMTLIDGEEVYRHVQTEVPGSKVIISSFYGEEEMEKRLSHSIPFLRKPFSLPDLIDQAQTLLLDSHGSKFQNH